MIDTAENAFPAPMLMFGCGNMAGAMAAGWIAAGVPGAAFHVVKPTKANLPEGAAYFASVADVPRQYDTLLIGIKPQMLPQMAEDIRALLAPNALVISILGGVGSGALARYFPDARILRVMPNLAVSLGKSPLGLFGHGLSDADGQDAAAWLSMLGTPHWMEREDDMHAFTAIAGCGPAYLYRFISAMARAGAALGLNADQAALLAKEMAEGAALLAAGSPHDPDELANRVASKGGSTAAGLSVLDQDNGMQRLITATLTAARDRSVEQGKEG